MNNTSSPGSKLYSSLVNWFSEDPKRYNLIYLCINWGLSYNNVANLINLKPDRKVLEIACGSSLILGYVGDSYYIGIESNEEHLKYAGIKYSSRKNTEFIHADILEYDFTTHGSFDKILMLGVMHHFSDQDLTNTFSAMSKLLNKENPESALITFDPVRTKYHFISNKLCDLDVGRYVRYKDEYLNLLDSNFDVKKSQVISSRTKAAMYLINKAISK